MRPLTFVALVAGALILVACANRAAPAPRTYPVSKFVYGGGGGQPIQAVQIDPKAFGGGYDSWDIRNDYREKPLALHNPRTVRAIVSATTSGYIDQPLCQASPTIHVWFTHERWGRVMYENLFGQRSLLRRQIQTLIEANCAPGVVKTVQLAVFVKTRIRRLEDMRYLDRYDAAQEGADAGRYVYYGLVVPADDYAVVHHDASGLARYLRTNSIYEGQLARMEANREAERRLQQEGIGVIFTDYCKANPLACAGFAAMILQAGGGGPGASSTPASSQFMTCMTNCRFRAPAEQSFCQATCYEFVAR